MSEDDAAYRRSERNMALVLAAIATIIFAAILVPSVLNPVHEGFASTGSTASPYGFTLNLRLNATSLGPAAAISITAWLNSTTPQPNNLTAASHWPIGPGGLWTRPCTSGWPLGVGVMRGYYTPDNYSSGSLVYLPVPLVSCPVGSQMPSFFVFQPFGTAALVELGGSALRWDLQSTLSFVPARLAVPPQPGAYTAVAADEWGDIVLAHFRISQ